MNSKIRMWMKLVIPVAVIAIVAVVLRKSGVDFRSITVEDATGKIKELGIWGPVVYTVFYVIRPLVAFPAAVLSATAGLAFGLGPGFLILQIAANISSTAEFLIARYVARESITRFVERRMKGKMADINEKIERRGFLTVLLIRLIPNAPWDVQNFMLGLTSVKFRDYFLATLIGIMPGSFALVFFGGSLIKTLTNPKNVWMIGVAVVVFVGVMYLQKFLKKRHGHRIEKKH